MHSELVRREAERFGYRYVDMVGDFQARLGEADAVVTAGAIREEWERSGSEQAGTP
jgi:hypothetical protein